ncbi:MAG: DnaJ domain-containing protein [Elusimicrobia bacterium]|nr:DnaJ domain-containing protein [Elusimicrobiota bacterium]
MKWLISLALWGLNGPLFGVEVICLPSQDREVPLRLAELNAACPLVNSSFQYQQAERLSDSTAGISLINKALKDGCLTDKSKPGWEKLLIDSRRIADENCGISLKTRAADLFNPVDKSAPKEVEECWQKTCKQLATLLPQAINILQSLGLASNPDGARHQMGIFGHLVPGTIRKDAANPQSNHAKLGKTFSREAKTAERASSVAALLTGSNAAAITRPSGFKKIKVHYSDLPVVRINQEKNQEAPFNDFRQNPTVKEECEDLKKIGSFRALSQGFLWGLEDTGMGMATLATLANPRGQQMLQAISYRQEVREHHLACIPQERDQWLIPGRLIGISAPTIATIGYGLAANAARGALAATAARGILTRHLSPTGAVIAVNLTGDALAWGASETICSSADLRFSIPCVAAVVAAGGKGIYRGLSLLDNLTAVRNSVDDAYRTLGLKPDATLQEVKSAYRKLAREHHPDFHAQKSPKEQLDYADKMKKINAAYQMLDKRMGKTGQKKNTNSPPSSEEILFSVREHGLMPARLIRKRGENYLGSADRPVSRHLYGTVYEASGTELEKITKLQHALNNNHFSPVSVMAERPYEQLGEFKPNTQNRFQYGAIFLQKLGSRKGLTRLYSTEVITSGPRSLKDIDAIFVPEHLVEQVKRAFFGYEGKIVPVRIPSQKHIPKDEQRPDWTSAIMAYTQTHPSPFYWLHGLRLPTPEEEAGLSTLTALDNPQGNSGGASLNPPKQTPSEMPQELSEVSLELGKTSPTKIQPANNPETNGDIFEKLPEKEIYPETEIRKHFRVLPHQVEGSALSFKSKKIEIETNPGTKEKLVVKSWLIEADGKTRAQKEFLGRAIIRTFFSDTLETTQATAYKSEGEIHLVTPYLEDVGANYHKYKQLAPAAKRKLAIFDLVFGYYDAHHGNILLGRTKPLVNDFEDLDTDPTVVTPADIDTSKRFRDQIPYINETGTNNIEPLLEELAIWKKKLAVGSPQRNRLSILAFEHGLDPDRYLQAIDANLNNFEQNLRKLIVIVTGQNPLPLTETPSKEMPKSQLGATVGQPREDTQITQPIDPEQVKRTLRRAEYESAALLGNSPYSRGSYYLTYRGKNLPAVPEQGIKFHISATPETVSDVVGAAARYLQEKGVNYKIAQPHKLADFLDTNSTLSGKLVTVYPKNEEDAVELMKEIDGLLAAKNLKNNGSALHPKGDFPFGGNSGLISWRMGRMATADPDLMEYLLDRRGNPIEITIGNEKIKVKDNRDNPHENIRVLRQQGLLTEGENRVLQKLLPGEKFAGLPQKTFLSEGEVRRHLGALPHKLEGRRPAGWPGRARLVSFPDGGTLAVKEWDLDLDGPSEMRAKRELFLSQIIGRYFPEFEVPRAFAYKTPEEIYLVSEPIAGVGPSAEAFHSLSETQKIRLSIIALGFDWRDANKGNILFGGPKPVLIDFESSSYEPIRLNSPSAKALTDNDKVPYLNTRSDNDPLPYLKEAQQWQSRLNDPAFRNQLKNFAQQAGLDPKKTLETLKANLNNYEHNLRQLIEAANTLRR